MAWLKLCLEADRVLVQRVAAALEDCGALAVSVEEADTEVALEAALDTADFWPRNRITGLFPAGADAANICRQVETRIGQRLRCSVDRLQDQAWETAWRAHFRPLCFGGRLWVCPTWCTAPAVEAAVVFLDPGLAFGSGTHASTRLCLEWLAGQSLAGKDVIDYGCGSGILAIAALTLGARRAWGIDTDPRALQVSRENAARNGVNGRYLALTPQALPVDAHAHIVLANILANTLIELAPRLTQLVQPGGDLILAGLLAAQVDGVCACYADAFGLKAHFCSDPLQGKRWALLHGSRTSATH